MAEGLGVLRVRVTDTLVLPSSFSKNGLLYVLWCTQIALILLIQPIPSPPIPVSRIYWLDQTLKEEDTNPTPPSPLNPPL